MLELTSDERPVALSPGTSLQLECNSPLFDEEVVKGTFSYGFNVPAPPNGPVYGWPERLDADLPPGRQLPAELRLDGVPLLTGTQAVRTASAKTYNVSLSGGLGAVAPALSARQLSSFAYGGVRPMPPGQPYGGGAPGGLLQVPGWVAHANAVVRDPAAYDYVFAPVLAADVLPGPAAPAGAVPVVLNPWVQVPAGDGFAYGLPPGGSFAYRGVTGYADASGAVVPVYGQLASPFPRLRYVLRCVFEESGLPVDAARFLPGELGELVIVSPALAVRTALDGDGVLQSHFRLADALPDATVAELLLALRRGFGVVVDVDATSGQVYTCQLGDVVAAPVGEVPDWSDRLAGAAERTVEDAAALRLVYQTDPDDALTKDLLAQLPDPAALGAPVATLADLPATAPLGQGGQTRLVEAEDAYYQSTARDAGVPDAVGLTWQRLGPNLSVDVGGAGGEDYAQGFAYTALGKAPVRLDPANPAQLDAAAAAPFAQVPAMQRAGYQPDNRTAAAPARPAAVRLLFWRGLQPASDGTLYPLVSPLATNQAGDAVGRYSTRLSGPAGTYQQLLRGWLEVKRRAVVVKQPLRLSVLDLARLDVKRKIRLDGNEYLVRKLSVAVPLRKPATAELVQV